MKLKKVEVKFSYVIVVDDDKNADKVASETAIEALKDMYRHHYNLDFKPYKSGSIPYWTDESIPYGGDRKTTTGEYQQ